MNPVASAPRRFCDRPLEPPEAARADARLVRAAAARRGAAGVRAGRASLGSRGARLVVRKVWTGYVRGRGKGGNDLSGPQMPQGRVMSNEELEEKIARMDRPPVSDDDGTHIAPTTTHGGEAAVQALQGGLAFKGMAAKMEANISQELQSDGHEEIVRRAAVRLETAARLYWQAVLSVADSGDIDRLHSYVARFGWLQAKATMAWSEVRRGARRRAPSMKELLGEIGDVIEDTTLREERNP